MSDIAFVRSEYGKVLSEASKYANKDNETKRDFVLRVKEKLLILFELEKTPLSTLAAFIWSELDKIQFSIEHSWFEKCFTENEKRNYSDKYSTTHFISTENPDIEKNPTTGQIRVNNLIFSPDLPSEAKPKMIQLKDSKTPTKNKYTDLLTLIGDTATKLKTTADAILERYDDNVKLIAESFEPMKETQMKYAEFYAKIANSKDVLDDRNKWGDYEKIIARFLMHGGETIAHMSKLMDYSSKFGSIGILNNAELIKKIEQLGQCPSCHSNIYFEINERLKLSDKEVEIKAEIHI